MRANRAEAERAFLEHCSGTLALINDEPRIILDSTQGVLRRGLGANALAALSASNPGKVVPDRRRRGRCWSHRHPLRTHQPTPESLGLLEELAPDHIRNRADIALDLPTACEAHARTVTGFIGHHQTSPRRAHRALAWAYYAPDTDEDVPEPESYHLDRSWGASTRNAITYAKEIDGRWYCRIELRIFRARALRRYRLDRRSMLPPEEVRAFIRDHLDHVLRLTLFFDPWSYMVSVERMVDQQVRRRGVDPDDYRSVIYRTLARALSEPPNYDIAPDEHALLARFEHIPVQQIIDANPVLARDSVLHLPLSTVLARCTVAYPYGK
jgi:hypothetical protein